MPLFIIKKGVIWSDDTDILLRLSHIRCVDQGKISMV